MKNPKKNFQNNSAKKRHWSANQGQTQQLVDNWSTTSRQLVNCPVPVNQQDFYGDPKSNIDPFHRVRLNEMGFSHFLSLKHPIVYEGQQAQLLVWLITGYPPPLGVIPGQPAGVFG